MTYRGVGMAKGLPDCFVLGVPRSWWEQQLRERSPSAGAAAPGGGTQPRLGHRGSAWWEKGTNTYSDFFCTCHLISYQNFLWLTFHLRPEGERAWAVQPSAVSLAAHGARQRVKARVTRTPSTSCCQYFSSCLLLPWSKTINDRMVQTIPTQN